jgi:hypothetical protein
MHVNPFRAAPAPAVRRPWRRWCRALRRPSGACGTRHACDNMRVACQSSTCGQWCGSTPPRSHSSCPGRRRPRARICRSGGRESTPWLQMRSWTTTPLVRRRLRWLSGMGAWHANPGGCLHATRPPPRSRELGWRLWRADTHAPWLPLPCPAPAAYDCLHKFTLEWPCLSFDIIRDDLGAPRATFPHTVFMVAGTQAAGARQNYLALLRLTQLGQGRCVLRPHICLTRRTAGVAAGWCLPGCPPRHAPAAQALTCQPAAAAACRHGKRRQGADESSDDESGSESGGGDDEEGAGVAEGGAACMRAGWVWGRGGSAQHAARSAALVQQRAVAGWACSRPPSCGPDAVLQAMTTCRTPLMTRLTRSRRLACTSGRRAGAAG